MNKKLKILAIPALVLALGVGCWKNPEARDEGQANEPNQTEIKIEFTETEEEKISEPRQVADEFFEAASNFDTGKMDEMTLGIYNFNRFNHIGDQEKILVENILVNSKASFTSQDLRPGWAQLNYQLTSLDYEEIIDQAISTNLMNVLKNGTGAQLKFDKIDYDSIDSRPYDVTMELELVEDEWRIISIKSEDLSKMMNLS